MILHPGILALILGAGVVAMMMLYAGLLAVQILRHWDIQSSSARQLELERRSFLLATVVQFACAFQIASAFLFIFTADRLHPLFAGAMCATGSLNANPVGWSVLTWKVALLFLAGFWIVLHRLDLQSEAWPLMRLKNALILAMIPLALLDVSLLLRYFGGLEPEVITSCCGSLFSSRRGVAADLAPWPPKPTALVFWGLLGAFLLTATVSLRVRIKSSRVLLSALAFLLLPVSLAAVVSFISSYIYQLPTHHCPFDMLQRHYGYVGYPLYAGLFSAVFWGFLPGATLPLRRRPGLADPLRMAERRWLLVALASGGLFAVLVGWPIIFGGLVLLGAS